MDAVVGILINEALYGISRILSPTTERPLEFEKLIAHGAGCPVYCIHVIQMSTGSDNG
jgi:hypothetical protein